jgi:general secretion pathway protein G
MKRKGFTLIELLVTLAVISLLLSLAVPRYFGSLDRSKEIVLRENLHQIRDAIDKFYADRDRYPEALDELVTRRHIRSLPRDPVTDSDRTWIVLPPPDSAAGKVFDVKSGAPGSGRDETPYSSW